MPLPLRCASHRRDPVPCILRLETDRPPSSLEGGAVHPTHAEWLAVLSTILTLVLGSFACFGPSGCLPRLTEFQRRTSAERRLPWTGPPPRRAGMYRG